MFVKDAMIANVKTLYLKNSVRKAVQIFQDEKVGIIPVIDNNNALHGVFTRYSLYRALLDNKSLDSSIDSHIIYNVVTIKENALIAEASNLLIEHQTAHAIVISKNNQVIGIFGQESITRSALLEVNSMNSLLKNMHTGALAIDRHGSIIVMNQAAELMCGRTIKSCIGRALSELYPELNNILLSIQSNRELPLPRKVNIRGKKLLVTGNMLSYENNSWGGLLLMQEFTDYEPISKEFESNKKLEKTLQTLIETSYDGYILIDSAGDVRLINRSACEIMKISREQMIGKSIKKYLPELNLEETLLDKSIGEKFEAITIGKQHCMLSKVPIYRGQEIVGAIGKIVFKNLNKWKNVINRVDKLEKEVSYYRGELSRFNHSDFDIDDILSKNKNMIDLKNTARIAALGFSNVLLLGESGTGKELFARGIHNASQRQGRFIKVNCAAVPAELWESEFFGYADGAFTGAKRGGKMGKFESANNGTLFLDEIGDMPLSMQVKLLHVLQEREFERVGGNQTIHVNVRIVAATNKNLSDMIASGDFREDLYYRLNVIALNILPLRKRTEDIPLLSNFIAKKFSYMFGKEPIEISSPAMAHLSSHHWPGNVRELENVIERAITYMSGKSLDINHLPDYLREIDPAFLEENNTRTLQDYLIDSTNKTDEAERPIYFKKKVSEAEKEAVISALQMANGNRTNAAKILGISRSQLYNKLKKFDLNGKNFIKNS